MRLLGVHVGGEQATELVHLGLIAMMAEAGADLFNRTCFNYPTLGDLSIIDNGDARLVRLRELLGIRRRLDFSDSIDWVDPVIGLRGRVKIWKATKILRKAISVDLTLTLTLHMNCTDRGGRLCENRWIVLIGVTSWRAGSNFNS